MSITVYTQYIENYGAEEQTNYWKFKWGSKYIVEGTDERPANAVALVTHYIAKYNTNTNYAMEFVRSWSSEDEDSEGLYTSTTLQYEQYFIEWGNIVAPI